MWDLEGFMTLRDAAQLKKDNGTDTEQNQSSIAMLYQVVCVEPC